jgi:diaminobutyrate-2-oxoglutarate transaminase
MITVENERPAGAAPVVEDKASNAPVYVRNLDAVFARGLQSRVWDSAGNDYIDLLADGGALPLGHNHPDVMRRVAAFLSSGQILPGLDTPTPARRALVEQLMRALPPSFAQDAGIQFCGLTASDAVEAVRRLFKAATGRHSLIAFHGACHGLRPGSLSHGGEMHFFPYPQGHRCSFGVGGYRGEDLALTYLDNALGDPRNGIAKPAAVLVEAVQADGCIAASARWLRQLREITRKHEVPLVLDEMQTGFGRTGSMFAHEDAGIVPDAILLSKALGGGFPLAALAYHKRFDKWARGRAHPAVLGGSQIALVAGAATLEHIREGNIPARAQRLGSYLQERLRTLAGSLPCFGDIRGKGLMVGIEIVAPTSSEPPEKRPLDGTLAKAIQQACLRHGLILECGGPQAAVLRFLPALTIAESEIDLAMARLGHAVLSCLAAPEQRRSVQETQA